jgi:hypothetical protein
MNHVNLEKLLYRILLGYYYININNNKYKVTSPDLKTKYEAEILYDSIIEENKFDKRFLTLKEIEMSLIANNIWNPELDKKIKEIENQIEDTKVDIYLNFLNLSKKTFYEKNIESLKKILSQLYNKKNSFNHLSIEEHSMSVKNEFIISNTIHDNENKLVINYNDNLDYIILQNFIQEIVNNMIQALDIRELAKSNLWHMYSTTTNINQDILTSSDDYKLLISYTNMYNNVKQHPECPSQDIIEDDNALDGWSIHQNRKAEKDKKKQSILDKVGGKNKNLGDHMFIFTNNEEEIEAINDLNDQEQKIFKQEMAAHSKANPGIKWEDLPPIKRKIQMEAQKKADQQIKNRK